MKNRRERVHQLVNELQGRPVDEVKMMVELISLLFEEAKEKLVGAEGIDVPRTQGEARAFDRLYKDLTRPASTKGVTL